MENNLNISSAQYVKQQETQVINDENVYVSVGDNFAVDVVIDGETLRVPLDPANRHYAEILRQVDAGELTIQEAE
jgi:hypothetical protein